MSWAASPTDDELGVFLEKLHAWRRTLPAAEQRLVESMAAAALGQTGDEGVGGSEPFRDAGSQDPPDGDRAARDRSSWCAARWLATPWGMTHTRRYW